MMLHVKLYSESISVYQFYMPPDPPPPPPLRTPECALHTLGDRYILTQLI